MMHAGARLCALILIGAMAGCGTGSSTIPPGATEVHVVVTDTAVRLDPAQVPAGDIYLVLDSPEDGAFTLVMRQAAGETPGPLTSADLARVAAGDIEGTAAAGYAVGCSSDQRRENRGRGGYCGNVWFARLAAGSYAIFADAPESAPVPPMAVLEVVP